MTNLEEKLEQRKKYERKNNIFYIAVVLILVVSNLSALIFQSVQTEQFSREQSEGRNKAVVEIIESIDTQRTRSIEGSENILCYAAIQRPELFPGANLELCLERLRVINNNDGTFLSDEALR